MKAEGEIRDSEDGGLIISTPSASVVSPVLYLCWNVEDSDFEAKESSEDDLE